MQGEGQWDAAAALANLSLEPWSGRAWRFHRRLYAATDSGGSLLVSGRYHRAADQFPRSAIWPALYLALAPEVSLGELLRHFSPQLLPRLNEYRLSELHLVLEAVLDCREPESLGLAPDALVNDYDFTVTQALAAAAIDRHAEAVLVPSATGMGHNLVVFPALLLSTSTMRLVDSFDPRLYVPR